MWFIGVEVEQETSAPPPTKNPGSAPVTALLMKLKKDNLNPMYCILYFSTNLHLYSFESLFF